MNNSKTDRTKVIEKPVCEECSQPVEAGRIMYVHLCSGKVKEIPGVTSVRLTEEQIVLERAEGESVVFPRRDVYYACCDAGEQPAF
jgi:hypothetical protein